MLIYDVNLWCKRRAEVVYDWKCILSSVELEFSTFPDCILRCSVSNVIRFFRLLLDCVYTESHKFVGICSLCASFRSARFEIPLEVVHKAVGSVLYTERQWMLFNYGQPQGRQPKHFWWHVALLFACNMECTFVGLEIPAVIVIQLMEKCGTCIQICIAFIDWIIPQYSTVQCTHMQIKKPPIKSGFVSS